MPEFLKGSIIISLILNIVSAFDRAYKDSLLKRALAKTDLCFKNSLFYKILSAYVNKRPWYRYSLTYRLVFVVANLFDKLFAGIFNIVKAAFKGSVAADSYKKAYYMPFDDKCYTIGVLLISLPVGIILASIVFKSFALLTLVMSWGMFITGVMVVIVGVYGRDSLVIKGVREVIKVISDK